MNTTTPTNIQLYHGDCLEIMPSIPSGSVDMILCDLPYGTTACKWDTIIPLEPLWREYKRIIKRNGAIVLTASQPFTSALVMSNPKWFRYGWVWEKGRPTGFLDAYQRPLRAHEDVLVFALGRTTYNPQTVKGKPAHTNNPDPTKPTEIYGKHKRTATIARTDKLPRSVVYIATENPATLVHKTQKPVALMEYLIRTYTNEGETVLDNAMGSGTTGVACVNTGRNFIGIELHPLPDKPIHPKDNPDYFSIAQDRVCKAQDAPQQAVFS